MTLIPVSKISISGESARKLGGSRWIGQRSTSAGGGSPLSIGSPMTFQRRPRVGCPTGTVIGCPVSSISSPPGQAVRGGHGHGANAVAPEVLLDLGDQLSAVGRDAQRGVDLR